MSVELSLRIQEGDSIRSLPLTSKVVAPGNPDFAKIRRLVAKSLKPAKAAPARPSATPSPSATTTKKPTSSPSPTATPDDSQAVDLSATC